MGKDTNSSHVGVLITGRCINNQLLHRSYISSEMMNVLKFQQVWNQSIYIYIYIWNTDKMTFIKLLGVDFNIAQIVVLYGTSIWLFLWHLKMCGVALNILYESTQKGVDRNSYSCNFLCNMWNMLHKPDEHSHVESTYEAMCRGVDNEISIIPEIGLIS